MLQLNLPWVPILEHVSVLRRISLERLSRDERLKLGVSNLNNTSDRTLRRTYYSDQVSRRISFLGDFKGFDLCIIAWLVKIVIVWRIIKSD